MLHKIKLDADEFRGIAVLAAPPPSPLPLRYCPSPRSVTDSTTQSEMANTSPRHMPVLGNVHPIKIEKFDILSWRHCSLEFLYS